MNGWILFPFIQHNLMHIKGAAMHLDVMRTVFPSFSLQTRFMGKSVQRENPGQTLFKFALIQMWKIVVLVDVQYSCIIYLSQI